MPVVHVDCHSGCLWNWNSSYQTNRNLIHLQERGHLYFHTQKCTRTQICQAHLCSLHLKANESKAVCSHGLLGGREFAGFLCPQHCAAAGSWRQLHAPVCINNSTPLWRVQRQSWSKPRVKRCHSLFLPRPLASFWLGLKGKVNSSVEKKEEQWWGQNSAWMSLKPTGFVLTMHTLSKTSTNKLG